MGKLRSILLSILVLWACSDGGQKLSSSLKQLGLDPANPVAAAEESLRRQDSRLLAVRGYAVEVPGTSLSASSAESEHGLRIIPGTSDFAASSSEIEFNQQAREYATQYNMRVLADNSE